MLQAFQEAQDGPTLREGQIEEEDGEGGYRTVQGPVLVESQVVAAMATARADLLQRQDSIWNDMLARMVCMISIDDLFPLVDGRLLLQEQDALGREEDRQELGEDIDDDEKEDDGGNFVYVTDEEGQWVQDANGEWVELDEYLNREPYSYLESENEDTNEDVGDDEQ